MPSIFVPLLLAFLWTLVSLFGSFASGWMALTRPFRATTKPYGEIRSSFCILDPVFWRLATRDPFVQMTATSDALYLSEFILFRLFHPPLRIPWNEIQMEHSKFGNEVCLILGREEKILLTLPAGIARKLGVLERILNPGSFSNFETVSEGFIESMNRKFKFK